MHKNIKIQVEMDSSRISLVLCLPAKSSILVCQFD